MENEKLMLVVTSLIASKSEGEYWDFKQDFHENKASLLHDILCMANNLTTYDGLIIFGIQDRTFEVIGVEGNPNRRDLNYYINFLKDKDFAGGIRPKIEFHTVFVEGKAVDVLLIKNTDRTPYYITKDYADRGKVVKANYTYTRVGESNTDINKSADIDQQEKLWGKRLKITRKVPQFELSLLNHPKDGQVSDALSYHFEYPCGLVYPRRYNLEEDLIEGVTAEDLLNYNKALPDQKVIDKYNREQRLYECSQENCHRVFLSLENTGKARGTSIYITLFLPEGILAYSEYDCKQIKEPKRIKLPEDPIEKALEERDRKRFGIRDIGNFHGFESVMAVSVLSNQWPRIETLSVNSFKPNDFSISSEHDELEVHAKELLHTRTYESDDFFLIIMKRGKYEVEYKIMCEEFDEPQTGMFEIVAE